MNGINSADSWVSSISQKPEFAPSFKNMVAELEFVQQMCSTGLHKF